MSLNVILSCKLLMFQQIVFGLINEHYKVYSHSPPIQKLEVLSNSKLPDFELHIGFLEGRKHLPIIEIKQAA